MYTAQSLLLACAMQRQRVERLLKATAGKLGCDLAVVTPPARELPHMPARGTQEVALLPCRLGFYFAELSSPALQKGGS